MPEKQDTTRITGWALGEAPEFPFEACKTTVRALDHRGMVYKGEVVVVRADVHEAALELLREVAKFPALKTCKCPSCEQARSAREFLEAHDAR